MCNISIYQILLSFDALLNEEFSHRDETEASLVYFCGFLYHWLEYLTLGYKKQ